MLQGLRYRVRQTTELACFLCNRCISSPVVSSEPTFDAEGLKFFNATIAATSVYVEYGSGGSTLVASRSVRFLVSVDSDRAYSAAVAEALGQTRAGLGLHLIHADIGMVREWGRPVFSRQTKARRERWRRYSKAPWEILKKSQMQPDTILIDGRFRIACALESFLNIREGSACRILVDDYTDRAEYRVIERFGNLLEMHGRMAVFQGRARLDRAACSAALETAYTDPN
jgi:hypothetical protein